MGSEALKEHAFSLASHLEACTTTAPHAAPPLPHLRRLDDDCCTQLRQLLQRVTILRLQLAQAVYVHHGPHQLPQVASHLGCLSSILLPCYVGAHLVGPFAVLEALGADRGGGGGAQGAQTGGSRRSSSSRREGVRCSTQWGCDVKYDAV